MFIQKFARRWHSMSTVGARILQKRAPSETVVAVVGFSDKASRESNRIGHYLIDQGFRVYPVNPAVSEIDGMKSYASLREVPEAIDIVNVFRRSEFLFELTKEAVDVGASAVWAQLGVKDEKAEALAQDNGLDYVHNLCIFVEHSNLGTTSS